MIENPGMRASMRRDEDRATSAAAKAGDSEVPRAPSETSMSAYSPTSPADSPRAQDHPESAEGSLPSADDGRQPGHAEPDDDAVRAGLAS